MDKMKNLARSLRGLVEKDEYPNPPDNTTDMLKEIIEAYKEARQLTDEYLYDDHLKWLKWSFEEGHFEFPDDYDFSSSRWALGLMIAQTERYGGIVMETKKGTLPVNLEQPIDDHPHRITEK